MARLPPLHWLRAFEASARALSFTNAALELNLSYQHLGSKYQQPELLKVHSLKSALGSAFI